MRFGKIIGGVLFVALLYLLWQIRNILMLGFAAVVFATVINKLVQRLQKIGLPRGLAVTISLLFLLGLLVGAGWFIGPAIANQIPRYTFISGQGFDKLQEWYRNIRSMLPGDPLSDTPLRDLLPQLSEINSDWMSRLLVFFTGSLDFLLNTTLVIVLVIMLLANPKAYRRMLLMIFPKFYRRRADEILDECEDSISGWFIGVLFNMAVITLCSALGLSIIGVPLPLVNALIAGLLAFVPNIGPILSVIPPALMGLATAPWMAIAVLAMYFGIQQLEGMVLTPLVMEKQVSLLPAITLIAQVVFSVFFGLLGLFMALPAVIVIQVWSKELLVKDILNRWPAPRKPRRAG